MLFVTCVLALGSQQEHGFTVEYGWVSIRVYGQFCIETLHESRKRKSSGLSV